MSITTIESVRKRLYLINRVKWLAILTFLLATSFIGNSQSITPEAELDYTIEEFTLPGGRRGNNVNSIVQGPYGFMWFGTHGGLHRYDGYEFVTYKPVAGDTIGETTSLTFPYVESLYWDNHKILWVTTYGGGLFSFDPVTEKFKHYQHDPGDSTSISHQRVLCAIEDSDGNLWFGTEHGLNRFDRSTGKFKRYFADPNIPGSLHNDNIRSFYVDNAGMLWIGTGFVLYGANEGGLSRYNPESDLFTNYLPDPDYQAVRGILEDSRGNFWVGTIKGLHKFDRSTGTFKKMQYDLSQPFAPGINDLEFQPVYSILEDRNGGLWVGIIDYQQYPSHVIRYDTTLERSQIFPIRSSAWQMYESQDGTIWIAGAGTSGKVQKLKPKTKAYNLRTDHSIILNAYSRSELYKQLGGVALGPHNITVDPKSGKYWLQLLISRTYGAYEPLGIVLAEYNPETGDMKFHLLDLEMKPIDFNSFPAQVGVSGLAIDKQGNIWGGHIADNIGLFCYDPITRKTKRYIHDPNDPESITSNHINTIMIDSRGEVWAAAIENGLNRIDPSTDKITRYHFNQEGFGENDHPVALTESRDGKILVAGNFTYEGVSFVVELDPETHAMRKIPMPGFGVNWIVISMAQSKVNGSIAVVIGGNMAGVAYFNEEDDLMFIRDKESGFPFNNAAGVVCDNRGDFWVADSESSFFVRFTTQDDFVFEEASEIPTRWRSGTLGANGSIFFLTWDGGWVEIDPELIAPEIAAESSKIQMVDLFILGEKQKPGNGNLLEKPIWLMDELTLPADAENFGFRFSDMNFHNIDPRFQYRLYPYEIEWKKTGYIPEGNYYKVPPGNYKFQVRSVSMKNNVDDVLELTVIILPPWWRTWWAYAGYGFLFIGGVFVIDRVQRKRLLAKANTEAREKELVQARKIEKAYKELKATQSQLIQSEKMASLGELTAGIAHEIQNPLNFVNNFSEVNKELLEEMKEELDSGHVNEAKELASNVIDNEEKIIFHGKRADSIVKGMLQHSRASNGEKVPTDINGLADEYLRLAYHGLRAKDKSFNAIMKTNFAKSLDKINIVPQDIGRVILNLITNAFYAVLEKKHHAGDGYEPTVTVSTIRQGNHIKISVADNGNGIPEHIKEKIFQPFFTTKPTGQGTGLGLSLSYDIVKAHGGELRVETKPARAGSDGKGEGSEFIIQLPIV